MSRLRWQYLDRQLSVARSAHPHVKGEKLSFDEESKALYDAVAPTYPAVALPGDPRHAREAVPRPGLARRALRHVAQAVRHPAREARRRVSDRDQGLPRADDEARHAAAGRAASRVEYVTNKSWSGYNWYQGTYRSLIQVNTDLPIYIDRAIDLACHEGYPGHHVYNALLEKHLVRDRGWVEFTVYPLFSPQSLIAEGTANYGIEVAFPGRERIDYERTTLFPAAGHRSRARRGVLRSAGARRSARRTPATKRRAQYLNGTITAAEAAAYLEKYALYAPDRAQQRVRFIEQYRSYVINYNLGKDMVRRYIESRGGSAIRRSRWAEFATLLSSPRLPSGLQ